MLTIVIVRNIATSTFGRALLAVREDEIAAEAMGINTTRSKVMAFVDQRGARRRRRAACRASCSPTRSTRRIFTFVKSIEIIVMIVLGGMGSITGAVIGATTLTILPEALRDVRLSEYPGLRMVIYALLLILLMIFRPQGLLGRREFGWDARAGKTDPRGPRPSDRARLIASTLGGDEDRASTPRPRDARRHDAFGGLDRRRRRSTSTVRARALCTASSVRTAPARRRSSTC